MKKIKSPVTATLHFDLTDSEGREAHEDALNAQKLKYAAHEFSNYFRNILKHDTWKNQDGGQYYNEKKVATLLGEIRTKFWDEFKGLID